MLSIDHGSTAPNHRLQLQAPGLLLGRVTMLCGFYTIGLASVWKLYTAEKILAARVMRSSTNREPTTRKQTMRGSLRVASQRYPWAGSVQGQENERNKVMS